MIVVMLTLGVVVLVLWAIDAFVRDASIKRLLNVIVVIVLVLWLLISFGILPDLDGLRFPR